MNDELILIENKIYEVRGTKVMLDFDLAELYGIETRTLKQAVRRNIERFPEDFMFMLTKEEANNLIHIGVSQNVISPEYNVGSTNIFAFTENGVSMLSSVRYRDGELRSIDRYLEQDAANMDVEGKTALEDMRDALSGFVYAPTPAEGFRSLATYERARGELGAADATLLQSIGIEPETPSRAEARALLLESIASLPDPKVYELSTKMPPLILLSYLQAALPSLFWLLPVVVTSLACTYLRCRSLLVFQVPATAHVRFLTAVALSLLLGLALLLVSMVPAAVVSLIKNGAGGSEYPVALIRAGASTTSMVGEAVLCSIPLLVMAYGVISVVAALTAAISRNPVVTGVVCAVLLVLGSLSAHVESAGMGVALRAPFASFDPASQVGTIGFLGRGTNAMPFGEVVGASGALLVVLGAVSPLMVRLSVPKIERG